MSVTGRAEAPRRPVDGSARPAMFGAVAGLLAALSFGAVGPFAKRFGEGLDAQFAAGLLSAGAAAVVVPVALGRARRGVDSAFRRSDLPALGVMAVAGGVVAPILLMVGLHRLSGMSASLLLNLEGPFTMVVGIAAFGEHLGRRAAVAAVAVFAGAALLGVLGGAGEGAGGDLLGVGLVAAACLAWALDNNLTQQLTRRDPFALVAVKASVAASVNLPLAFARGVRWPPADTLAAFLLLGAIGYGMSVVADAYALRLLGAVREAAVFAAAPFAGAVVAVPVLGERPGRWTVLAAAAMAWGLVVMLSERHRHVHRHTATGHDHRHRHDEHHRHVHDNGEPPGEAHAHQHVHEALEHDGEHVSDVHHRHPHEHRRHGGGR